MGEEAGKLSLDPEALIELREAAEWYEEKMKGAGEAFLAAADESLRLVRNLPAIGSSVPGLGDRPDVRRVGVTGYPYSIVYITVPSGVRVMAIAHTRRRPGYWRTRLR